MNILAFFAHPDDETMLAGGTLALLSRQSAAVTVLIATRGEGGETGEPPLCTREELGAVREEELRCACKALQVNLSLLDYIDPTVGPGDELYPFTSDETELTDKVLAALRDTRADCLISHGSNGEYGHPAHRLCYRAALGAIQRLGQAAPLFYTVQAAWPGHPRPRLMNANDPASMVLNLEPLRAVKTAAAMCHRTQHALFIRNTAREVGHPVSVPEVIRTLESLHRAWPPAGPGALPDDPLAALLLTSGMASRPEHNPNG